MQHLLLPLLLLLLASSPLSFSQTTTPRIQIRATTTTAAASSPAPPPSLTAVMSKKGCKLFAGLLSATPDVEKTFQDNVGSGLTVFCPSDSAVRSFAPKFKNLTADAKVSLLLYQAIPVYNSMSMLNSGNGVVNTLATDGTSKNYNFTVQNEGQVVTLSTGITKAAITATVVDADPLAVFAIDQVLEPRELFKPAAGPAPAPAPAAEPPAAHHKGAKSPPAPTPAGPESEPAADRKPADDNAGAAAHRAARWAAAAAAAAAAVAAVMMVVV